MYVRQVAHPQLSGLGRFEITFDKVGGCASLRRASAFAVRFGLQTKLIHQPAHTVCSDALAFITQRFSRTTV